MKNLDWFNKEAEATIKIKAPKSVLTEIIALLKEIEYNGKIKQAGWFAYYADSAYSRPTVEVVADPDVVEEVDKTNPITIDIKANCFG